MLKFTYLRPMNEMCITQRYVIIAYLLADREQRILTLSTQNLLRTWLTERITTRALDGTFGCLKQPNILSWLHWPRTYYLLQLLMHMWSVYFQYVVT